MGGWQTESFVHTVQVCCFPSIICVHELVDVCSNAQATLQDWNERNEVSSVKNDTTYFIY